MKRKLFLIGIPLVALFLLYTILGQTGILKVFHNPTTANEPNLKLGSYMVTTNLLTPKKGDLITYIFYDDYLGLHYRVHRLCGVQDDIIEIRNGILYVNNKNADKGIDLNHYYKISNDEYDNLPENIKWNENNFAFKINDSSYKLILSDKYATQNGWSENKVIMDKQNIDEETKKKFLANWNKDNFGPLKIPKEKAFVIGDNRDNSHDSRSFGFIDARGIKGKIIYP